MSVARYVRHPSRLVRKLRWWLLHVGRRRRVTLETANGLLTFDSRDRLIGKHLYVNGGFEIDYIAHAMEVLRRDGHVAGDGGTLLDVGANIGMISIALLRRGEFARAVAVEPSPTNFELLTHNVAQNGLAARFRCLPVALSDAAGTMELELSADNFGDNRLRRSGGPAIDGAFGEARRATTTVPVHTLDELAAEEPWLGPDTASLMWIDVQGFEGQCFAGARRFLSRGVPVVTEFWPYGIARSGMTPAEYVQIVASIFTHYHDLSRGAGERRPIAGVAALFDEVRKPGEHRELLLVGAR